ncbi:hypothetical protein N8467_01165, partial [bacterium]|nr:hypothetical protein [bacterium]
MDRQYRRQLTGLLGRQRLYCLSASNVSVPGAGVFAETIPRIPGTDMFTMYSASAGGPATVEKVYFDCVAISDGFYDGDASSADGGDESQSQGDHAYYLKLPSNYQTTSSNPS